MITSFDQLNLDQVYTYADYLTWKFNERVELIKGKIFKMSPAPTVIHQQLSRELVIAISYSLKGKPCQVFHAPFDVRLPVKFKGDTVLQPDITVVCDEKKLDEKGCNGEADLVVEILLPTSAKGDLGEKYDQYEEAGVKEYWVVYPVEGSISQFVLDSSGKYQVNRPYSFADEIKSTSIPGLVIPLIDIFPKSMQE
jgi:Uma2 family endonuclease